MPINSNKTYSAKAYAFLFLGISIFNTPVLQAQSHELFKGVVVDKKSQQVYIINPNGGIDAVSINSGLNNWHSNKVNQPILTNETELIAHVNNQQSGILSLISLDSKTGSITQSQSLEIPKEIVANVKQGLESKFDISATENTTSNKINWQHKSGTVQGMISDNPQAPKVIYGEISLNNSKSLASANGQILSQKAKNKSISIESNYFSHINGRQFKSITGEHILVSNRKDDPRLWNKYKWDIYDLTGELIGSISNSVSYSPFSVIDDVILFVSQPFSRVKNNKLIKQPLSTNAFSLDSGKQLWNQEILDLKYQGPYPQ